MEHDDIEQKVNDWLQSLEDKDMICFNCKQEARLVYAPEDLSWGPYLVCDKCQQNFNELLDFANDKCAPGVH